MTLIDDFIELFNIPIVWDIYALLLILAFLLLGALGYYLIAEQIKLVKAEIFSIMDHFKCLVYGFIFASATIIIIALMVIFGLNIAFTPLPMLPPTGDFSIILLWPLGILLVFLLGFPLFDFLYMAHSKENKGLIAYQKFIAENFIHKVERPFSYIFAFISYFVIYILPPFILVSLLGFPFIIAIMSWAITIPIIILLYFGTRGLIAATISIFNNIPSMERNLFLIYDRNQRFSKEFKDDWLSRVQTFTNIWLIIWTTYALIRSISKIPLGQVDLESQSFEWYVFISLFLGILGYFTRFWQRKVKFKWMDILFAAWLIAATGVNVLINYTLSNSIIYKWTFLHWSLTAPITEGVNFMFFYPAALIEEVTILVLNAYYFFYNRSFYEKSKFSAISNASQNFKPIPLFNFIRDADVKVRNNAEEDLIQMYGRIPYKKELELTDRKFMDPLFDAICDWNKYSKETGYKILCNFLKKNPELIAPKIIEALNSYNYDKKIIVAESVLKYQEKIIKYIPIEVINSFLVDNNYQVRRLGLKILPNYIDKSDSIKNEVIVELLDDPDFNVQAESLNIVNKLNIPVNPAIILKKLNHPNKKIKSAAALSLANIGELGETESSQDMVKNLLKMLNSPDWATRSVAIKSLAKIGNFRKNNIPYSLFLEGISDKHKEVRDASQIALKKFLTIKEDAPEIAQKSKLSIFKRRESKKEKIIGEQFEERQIKESELVFNELLLKISHSDDDVKVSIFNIMEEAWILNPDKIIPTLMENLKAKNPTIQKAVSNVLIKISNENPDIIIHSLLKMKEEQTYIKKGIVCETIINICKQDPALISNLELNLEDSDENVRLNTASSLGGIAESNPEKINLSLLINSLLKETSSKVKRELLKFIADISESNSEAIVGEIDNILSILQDDDKTVRIAALKMLIPLSKSTPIPLDRIKDLLKDEDSSIRESVVKIIGNSGTQDPENAFNMLKEMLHDEKFSVKNAAMEMFVKLGM
ncbi:MAG: hypothetical protein GY870_16190, partial [archaeon]|nr:hypothetical protein [archaeon]